MTLIFIYNANSGKLNALLDAGHKLFSPSTYPCSLCALTYNSLTENSIWKNFRKKTELEMEFLHKDEFEDKYPNINLIYPTVLKLDNHQFTTVLNSAILNNLSNAEELIERLEASL